MTPMDAWSIISANLANYYRHRRADAYKTGISYKGYDNQDLDAEVICFKALQKMQNEIEDD